MREGPRPSSHTISLYDFEADRWFAFPVFRGVHELAMEEKELYKRDSDLDC